MKNGSGHYMAIVDGLYGGVGQKPGYLSVSHLSERIMAHELGHNLNLGHTVCNNPGGPDPNYPYAVGAIGVWGYDLLNDELVGPGSPDLMGYCLDPWISDYHFNKAMAYRRSQETTMMAVNAPKTQSLLFMGWCQRGR